ncbi:MAG TPA: hypothetical protein VM122_07775, partial [Usitatibacter sp.]|nr:hypothetical protein [Usitatibacter sp.]
GTPGHDGGMRIANFNDDFLGVAPDVGASEAGAPPMRFGLAASPGSSVSASPGADLSVSQSASANPAATGKDVMFTLAAGNAGPAAASGVSVVDSLPPGWTFVWASPGCAHSAGTVTCTVSTLANGAGVTFKIVARPSAPGSATNTVTITGAQFDSSTGNNASSLTVGVNASPPGTLAIRYRLYSPVTQEHLFTTDRNEYDTLGAQAGTWNQEGEAGKVLNNPGTFNGVTAVPYYRLYNTQTRWHHWTTDANEYYTLIQFAQFNAEGVDGYLLPTNTTGATQLYRLLYPDGRGLHHWTIDSVEYDILISQYGWIGEGGSGFVIR